MHHPLPILAIACCAAALAQQSPVSNASVQTLPVTGGLEAAIQSALSRGPAPMWIGYAVPAIPGENNSCCWSNGGSWGCGLDGQRATGTPARAANTPVKLEGPGYFAVLLRAENGAVTKVRGYSIDCPLDAGGLPFLWFTGVRPADSVAMLLKRGSAVDSAATGKKSGSDSHLHAIAMHQAPEADSALESLATAAGSAEEIRKKALFWLANSRGRRGYQVVAHAAREDASEKVREHAIFALTQSKEPEAIPAIIRIAKEDKSPRVRGQALFWMSQQASRDAAEAITESIENDPETEVKKKAVFALSQLPGGEGVPKLIDVARRNTNPAVRKQAMFWLGQSKDPRALQFLEEVLTR